MLTRLKLKENRRIKKLHNSTVTLNNDGGQIHELNIYFYYRIKYDFNYDFKVQNLFNSNFFFFMIDATLNAKEPLNPI